MAAAAGKAVRTVKTTRLMMPDEGFEAMLLAQGAKYVPPSASLRAARPGALPRPWHAAAVRVSARLGPGGTACS